MTKKIFFILMVVLSVFALSTPLFADNDGRVVIDELAGGYWYHYRVEADSNETFTSPRFDASAIYAYLLTFPATDTTVSNYTGGVIITVVTGTSSDSLSYLRLQGALSNGTYRVFDSLATAKNTPIRNVLGFYDALPYYPANWQFTGKVFDTGTKAAVVYVDIFVPYTARKGGGGIPGENAKRAVGRRNLG